MSERGAWPPKDALSGLVAWAHEVGAWRRNLMGDIRSLASSVQSHQADVNFFRYEVPVVALTTVIHPTLEWDRRKIITATRKLTATLDVFGPNPLDNFAYVEIALDDPLIIPDLLAASPDYLRARIREALEVPYIPVGTIDVWLDQPAPALVCITEPPETPPTTDSFVSQVWPSTWIVHPVEDLLAELRDDLRDLGRISGQYTWRVVAETAGRYEESLADLSGYPIEDGSLGLWFEDHVDEALFQQFVRSNDSYPTVRLAHLLVADLSLLRPLHPPGMLVLTTPS